MNQPNQGNHLGRHTDRADVMAVHTAWGADVELMRTWYSSQTFPRHTHEYFTIGVVLRGVGTLWYRGSETTLHPGDVVVIPPGEVHTGGLDRGSSVLSYLAVHVPANFLPMLAGIETVNGGRPPDFTSAVVHDAEVAAELRRLDSVMNGVRARTAVAEPLESVARSRIDDAAADDALCAAIRTLVDRHAAAAVTSLAAATHQEPSVVRIARDIIEDCFGDNTQTSLHALALRANVSPCHLVRVFTRTVGLSPHRYLVQTRVRRASQLLARGVPPSFVAAMTGFADQSHLTTQFKRFVGTTPTSYQRAVVPR